MPFTLERIQEVREVEEYYSSLESRFGYRLFLKGDKHLGWHADGSKLKDSLARQRVMDEVYKRFRFKKDKRAKLLDAGCGLGGASRYISKKYAAEIDGISIVPFEVQTCKKKAFKQKLNCNYSLQSYDDLSFEDEVFDGIYTIETLFHAKDPQKVFKEFYRVLKPEGRVVLCEYSMALDSNFLPEEKQFSDFVLKVGAGHGMKKLRYGAYKKMLIKAGFSDIKVENRSREVRPSLVRLYRYARLPSKVIRFLRLEAFFGNTLVAERWYELYEQDLWHYVVVTAIKPKAKK